MKHVKRIFITAAALLLVYICTAQCFASGGSVLKWTSSADQAVYTEAQDTPSGTYLFLPSSADFSDLILSSPEDAALTFGSASASLSAGVPQHIDLTAAFGEMQPGQTYSLRYTSQSVSTEVRIVRSCNVSSMHISIDKELSVINSSPDKSESAAGTYYLVTAEGAVRKAGNISEFSGRGNSSWERSKGKQPYAVTLEYSDELIENAGNSKKWCLLSDNVDSHDTTGLGNRIALAFYRKLGGLYALGSESVDLFVNGEYRGTYLLTEKVTFSKGSVPIDDSVYSVKDSDNRTLVLNPDGVTSKPRYWDLVPLRDESLTVVTVSDAFSDPAIASGIQAYQYSTDSVISSMSGYLLEIDFRFYGEPCWFLTRRGYPIVIKDPKYASAEEVQKIAAAVQQAEDALFSDDGYNAAGKYYADYFDLDSWSRLCITDGFMSNLDAHRASTYFSVRLDAEGEAGTLCAGPAWDYDNLAMYSIYYFSNDSGQLPYYVCWLEQLFRHGDFVSKMNELNSDMLSRMIDELNAGGLDEMIKYLSASEYMNNILWSNRFEGNSEYFKSNFAGRTDVWRSLWSNERLTGVTASYDRESGVLSAQYSGTASSLQWYRIYDGDLGSPVPVEGATGESFAPEEEGIYCVSASGKSIIFNGRARARPEIYTVHGFVSLTADETAPMFSNPVDTRLTEAVSPVEEEPADAAENEEPLPVPEEETPADEEVQAPVPAATPAAESSPADTQSVKDVTEKPGNNRGILIPAAAAAAAVICIAALAAGTKKKKRRKAGRKKGSHEK